MTTKDKIANMIDKNPLAKAKIMYFFYEAISKSLPGYLASYYKHTLLLAPHQVSILVAARYFAVLFGSPVLGSIADRLGRPRNILIVTLLALLATYLIVPIVEPIDGFNCKEHLHKHPIKNYSILTKASDASGGLYTAHPDPLKGHYHNELMFGLFYSWPFEAWEYEETDGITKKVFVTLLVVTLVGEFFASPSETFIDLYTLQTLKSERDRLGLQILPGVFGWMIVSTVFIFLQSIQQSSYNKDFCLVGRVVDSTPYLFVVYGMILVCLLIALMLQYNTDRTKEETDLKDLHCSCVNLRQAKCLKALSILFSKPAYVAIAIAAIFSGFGSGTKTLFIYSYIKDLGGSPILFFAILAVDFVSNVIALILSPWLIKKCGHENLIAAGLFINGITFVTYSMIDDPTLVMIVEPFDGICNSLAWVSLLTYVGCPPQIGAALQGLIHGLYRGLGVAIGYFIVSVFILKFGYLALFIGLGLTYFIVLCGFICVTNIWPAPTIADEYTRYSLLLDNPDDVYLSETESEVSTVASLYNNNNEVIDTSFLN